MFLFFLFFSCCLLSFETMNMYCFMSVLSAFSSLEHKTRWLCCLHPVVFFVVLLFCLECLSFCFHPIKRKAPPQQKNGHRKKAKNK